MIARVGQSFRYNLGTFPTTSDIQALLNGGASEIVLGAGTLNITSPLSVPANVTLRGDGPNATTIKWNTASATTNMITLLGGARLKALAVDRDPGAGAVTNGVVTGGTKCTIEDVRSQALPISIQHIQARIMRSIFAGGAATLDLLSDMGLVESCRFEGCARSIYISSGSCNLVKSNIIAGTTVSTRGIHMDGTSNFNLILHNIINSIILSSPGNGIQVDSGVGASNQISHNIFAGSFGGKALTLHATVPATTQVIGNQTGEVTPAGARLVLADLGGATGFMNT